MTDLLWPPYTTPADIIAIESLPLAARGIPESMSAALRRAATLWPERIAVTVLPDASRRAEPECRTFAELLADVHRSANVLRSLGVQRHDAVAIISPNCDELITVTLAAQLVGIAAPINGALSVEHIAELVTRAGARVLVAAAPELDAASWDTAQHLINTGVVDTVLALHPIGAVTPANSGVKCVRSFPDNPRPGSVGQRLPYQQLETVRIDTSHGSTPKASSTSPDGPKTSSSAAATTSTRQ